METTTTTTVSPVQIVTIKNKIPLFKGEEQANAIEKIEIEENGFSLVAQKDLYGIGDKAVYIQPDYSLSDIPLFESFIRPFGDPKKSKLGSNYRIRAVKFNLHVGDNEPVYSVGILLPVIDVVKYLQNNDFTDDDLIHFPTYAANKDLVKELGITKWEEPDNSNQPGVKANGGKAFPDGVYKTDETNMNNLWGHLEHKVGYPVHLLGSQKVDGSSISIIAKNSTDISVGSRTFIKPEMVKKVIGVKPLSLWGRIKRYFDLPVKYDVIEEVVPNDDEFVVLAKPYVDKIKELFNNGTFETPFILRGEANGQKWKGSGNKNNPNSKSEPNIVFYGVDDYSLGISVKADEPTFQSYIDKLGFNRCEILINKVFNSREEIEKECREIFKTRMIEGIVLRTPDSKFSGKFMNDEYDHLK